MHINYILNEEKIKTNFWIRGNVNAHDSVTTYIVAKCHAHHTLNTISLGKKSAS